MPPPCVSSFTLAPPNRAPSRVTSLSRELVDFLIELSIAMQKFAIYPLGHPMLATTTDRLERRLLPLLVDKDTLSLGVAHNQLVIEGIATEEHHAVLRDLAQRLHRHHLGAVKIIRGVDQAELREFLLAVGVEQAKDATPIGLLAEDVMPTWPHVRLFPLAYEHLELLEDEATSDARMVGDRRGAGGARSARLWVGLARAALAGREIHEAGRAHGGDPDFSANGTGPAAKDTVASGGEGTPGGEGGDVVRDSAADPEAVARAIDEHKRDAAYDQVIVGYLLQIADELRTAEGRDATALRARVSKLLSAMRPETLRTLLTMGNDVGQRRKFILDATQGMAVDAVLELVRAGSDVSKQNVSHSMLRMLSKLAHHAGHDVGTRAVTADAALRDNVRMLVSQWTLDDPNPEAYREVLQGMSKARPTLEGSAPTLPVEDERMVQMALEIGVVGESTWRAVDSLLARGRLATLLALLDRAPRPAAAQLLWDRLATTDRVRDLLTETQPDWSAVDKLVARIGVAAAEPLIDALESERDPRRQTQIVGLLAKLGSDVMEFVMRRLRGATPELQMQLLALLGRLPDLPAGFSPVEWAKNRSPLVRREAIKLLLRRPATRDQGITLGLLDDDERTIIVALNQAAIDCPASAIPIIMNRVDRDSMPAPLRALAIAAAARTKSPDIIDWLLRFTMVGRKGFFGGGRFPPKSPELLAALSALNTHWKNDSRVENVLARAQRSTDADVRAAASTLSRPSVAIRAMTTEKP